MDRVQSSEPAERRRPSRRRRAVAVSAAAFGATLIGALAAQAVTGFGTITLSGAVHGTHVMTNRKLQCIDQTSGGIHLYLYGSLGKNPATGAPSSGPPVVNIDQLASGVSTKSVDLATSQDYLAQLTVQGSAGQTVWISGWGSHSGVPPYHHLGSGALSMSANGKSGSLTTTMVKLSGPGASGSATVKATWNCG